MNDLKYVIEELQKSKLIGIEKEKHFVKIFPEITSKYPKIIKMACDDEGFDYDKAFWMIEQKNKVDAHQMTQYSASVEVGELLVNDFIKPVIS